MWPPQATWQDRAAGDLEEVWTPARRRRNAVRRRLLAMTIPALHRLIDVSSEAPFVAGRTRPLEYLEHCLELVSPAERRSVEAVLRTFERGFAAQKRLSLPITMAEAMVARVTAEEATVLLDSLAATVDIELQRHP